MSYDCNDGILDNKPNDEGQIWWLLVIRETTTMNCSQGEGSVIMVISMVMTMNSDDDEDN